MRRAKEVKDFDTTKDLLPVERALGVQWCVQSDHLQFRVELADRPLTRRGILSTVSSIYDPLGLVAPFVLQGKRILQAICQDGTHWDDPIPDHLKVQWVNYKVERRAWMPRQAQGTSLLQAKRLWRSQNDRTSLLRRQHLRIWPMFVLKSDFLRKSRIVRHSRKIDFSFFSPKHTSSELIQENIV